MKYNNIFANLFNITNDCFVISNNVKINTNEMPYITLSLLLNYSREEELNIKALQKEGFDLYIDEDFINLLYTDNNRRKIHRIFNEANLDLVEISGKNVDTNDNSQIFVDNIHFQIKREDISEEIKNIQERFDFEKVGLNIDQIDDNHIKFKVMNITRRIKNISIYARYNIDLIEAERQMEIKNNDNSRNNILKLIKYYMPEYNLKILEYEIKESSLEDNLLCLNTFLIKYNY